MKPKNLLLRCYAHKQDDQWGAFCLDLCLAAQGDSFEEAKAKLDSMIGEYVYDATVGEDKGYAEQLLSRKAPLDQWATYYLYKVLIAVHAKRNDLTKLFKETLPLVPYNHRHA